MALVRRSPFSELADMRREMQSLAGLMASRLMPFTEDRFIPAMDVTTRGEDVVIKVEIPAVDVEKDVDISVDQGTLRISGRRSEEHAEDREGYYVREMRYGSFERTFPLPRGVGAEAVTAEYRDGILEVTVAGGAKQMSRPEAQRIQITRGTSRPQRQTEGGQQAHSSQEDSQSDQPQGAAPEIWAPADSGTLSASSAEGAAGSDVEQQQSGDQPRATPD
jgi:HSP20 family protein